MPPAVKIEGLAELGRKISETKDGVKSLKKAMRDIAQYVADRARPRAPRRTGRLAGSVRASSRKASSRKGPEANVTDARIYANPIHWGWPSRNIKPQPWIWDTVQDNKDGIDRIIDETLHDLERRFN